jgi:hypothetical protein
LLAKVRPRDIAGKARRRVAAELIGDLEGNLSTQHAVPNQIRDSRSASALLIDHRVACQLAPQGSRPGHIAVKLLTMSRQAPRLVARLMPRSSRDDPDESTGRRGSSSDSSAADWRSRLAPRAGGAANGTPSFLTSPADRGGRLGQPVRELLLTDPRTEESPRRRAEQPACRGSRTYSLRMKDGTRIWTTVAATTMLQPRVPADVPFLGWPS